MSNCTKHATCQGPCRREKKTKVRGRIRPVSKRMTEQLKRYKDLRYHFLKGKVCPVTGKPATEVHHKRGRGRYLLDVTTWLGVTREGHRKIEENPEWAKENGHSESRLK